jgi:circadian clock protein KaiC
MEKATTGVVGLDDILAGGLSRESAFLLEGEPGTGKTTLALQFLLEGAARGERGLYITLSETEDELRRSAEVHGWSLGKDIEIFELTPADSVLDGDQRQSLLYSSDLELGETIKRILDSVERFKPDRVVIDSLSEVRLLAQNALRYRRQVLALKHYFARTGATVLMLDDMTSETADKTVHSVAHGVIKLEELTPEFGAERRRLRVMKYRGQKYRGGYHDFIIATGGLRVFPRLVASEHRAQFKRARLSSGIEALDDLLGGGVDNGSSTLILGPAGAGKSLMALTFAMAAVARGEKAALFVFDEELGLLFDRMANLGIDLPGARESGLLNIQQVDAAELSPGEFAAAVCETVVSGGATTVVIDSLNGYHAAMPEETSLTLHVHELLQFLTRHGASTFLTVAQHGLVGDMKSPVDITYIADTVVLLRYFEAMGRVLRAMSAIKKRSGAHESTIREFRIGAEGLVVGEPLEDFHGVLRGVPTYSGKKAPDFRT